MKGAAADIIHASACMRVCATPHLIHVRIHTHVGIYIYMYMYICMCVCVQSVLARAPSPFPLFVFLHFFPSAQFARRPPRGSRLFASPLRLRCLFLVDVRVLVLAYPLACLMPTKYRPPACPLLLLNQRVSAHRAPAADMFWCRSLARSLNVLRLHAFPWTQHGDEIRWTD